MLWLIDLKKACSIAKKEFKDLELINCIDIGDKYVFSFGVNKDDVPPGLPIVCVQKENGKVSYMTIPPLENLKILENGKEIEV